MANRLNVQNIYASDSDTTAAVQVSGANVTLNGTANDLGTVSAGTIGTGVTINAGSNVSGINQLVGISWNSNSTTGETSITVENNKSYVGVLFAWETSTGYTIPPELFRFSVNGSGVVTTTPIRSWSGNVNVSTGTNTITADVTSTFEWATLLLFEEGQTIDTV